MIQIDMPMPENCVECRFNVSEFGYCNAMPVEFCGYVNDYKKDGKPEWCPLKAQEPRVMKVGDVRNWVNSDRVTREPIVIEIRGGVCAWIIDDEARELPGNANLSSDLYSKNWRCWTSRPTAEQREAVKWE